MAFMKPKLLRLEMARSFMPAAPTSAGNTAGLCKCTENVTAQRKYANARGVMSSFCGHTTYYCCYTDTIFSTSFK